MVELQLAQVREARVALAKIIKGDADSHILQRGEDRCGMVYIVDDRVLGHFDDQAVRVRNPSPAGSLAAVGQASYP